jgi:hypothetical protein
MSENNKREKMDWECEYCGKEFKTSQETDEHELNCKKKPIRIKGVIKTRFGVWEGFKFGIGLALAILVLGLLTFIIATVLGVTIFRSILG